MKIYDFKLNRCGKVLGVSPENISFSFKAERGERFRLSVYSHAEKRAEYALSVKDIVSFYPDCEFCYGEEYSVKVENEFEDFATLDFTTAEKLTGKWLETDKICPIFKKEFDTPENYKNATLTITALGVYVVYLNGKRLGNNYLAPGMNDYDDYVRYQTYTLENLKENGNVLEVWCGNGWYMGRFGIDGHGDKTWGDKYLLNAVITFNGDEKKQIYSDESWLVSDGYVVGGGIYDGETRYDNKVLCFENVKLSNKKPNAKPENTAQITCFEERKGGILITPKGETVIDFMQNGAGIVSFRNHLKKGEKLYLQFGEILQDGNFYRDNLRTALAEYTYISDGVEKEVEPLFTFYGFRYVKVVCDGEWQIDDFTAKYLSSEMKATVSIKTDNEKLNKLISNVKWGQRSNFLDVPTDCPQRDERLGWTADTQVFCATACYNFETYDFYKKFMRDMSYDQKTYYGGDFPMYSPSIKASTGNGGAVWADAGVIVPWVLYKNYGDNKLLSKHYENVKIYVDKLIKGDEERKDNHLLSAPFTFGDWLAQDGICPQSLRGGTDDTFIRSAYYYYVVCLTAKMGEELKKDEYKNYLALAEEIKTAIITEYYTKTGRLALDTQASYIIALKFGLYSNKEKLISCFRERLRKDLYRIKCGFVGGPMMIQTMFENGMKEEAFRILFYEGYPGWFHEINLGATTVWERWNSVDDDGRITGIFMNSLNHYAYGSVAEAVYAHIGGIKNDGVAWDRAVISPELSHHVKKSEMSFDSPYGEYSCKYEINNQDICIKIKVPHLCKAKVVLPYSGKDAFEVETGEYEYRYTLTKDVLHPFSEYSPVCDILSSERASEILRNSLPQTYAMVTGENEEFKVSCVAEMVYLPMYGVTKDGYKKYVEEIRKVGF